MNGKLNVAIVLLGYIIAIIAIILIIITHTGKKTEYDLSIPEEPIPLEERIEHDLDVKFEAWEREKVVEVLTEEEPKFTKAEIELIATVVMSEASREPMDVKQAIAEVVINRLESDYREFRLQNAIDEVVFKPSQWAYNQEPTPECYMAVEAAIEFNDYPDDMLWARKDHVDYGYYYPVNEDSVVVFSTVTDYSGKEKAVWD